MAGGASVILANKDLVKDNALSATSEFDQFVDQPVKSTNNTGSLTLSSSGNYFGTAEIDMKITVKTAGDVGTSKFVFSDDGGVTTYGLNDLPIFEGFEVITGSI